MSEIVPTRGPGRRCPKCGARLFRDQRRCDACLLETALGEEGETGEIRPDVPTRFGDYELLRELGRGGQGVVYRARQKSLGRLVALKIIPLGHESRAAHVKRFRLEAEAVGSLDHPRIVPIHDIGEHEGYCYFSMKLVEGSRLDEVARGRPMAGRRAAEIVADLARTLHYAHQRGVLHRDVKPGNILLDGEGRPHLSDFGLAKLVEQESTVTRTREVLGTPSFMAPEQAAGRNQDVTTAADVYGLGAVLYFLLTGVPPFAGGTTYETIRQVIDTEPRPPRALNDRIDRDLETICLKCLAKEPGHRYGSAEALADELDRCLRGEPVLARQTTSAEKLWRWCRRKPALAASLGVSLLLLIVIAIGSSVAVMRIENEIERRTAAEQDAKDKLWNSYLAQARANRASVRAGHAFDGLAAIEAAARMRSSPELRDEAIALLAQTDLRLTAAPPAALRSTTHAALDADFARYGMSETNGVIALRRFHDDHLLAELPHPNVPRAGADEFSRDGRWLATSGPEALRYIWDLSPTPPVMRGKVSSVWGLTFSPDNRQVAAVLWSGHVELRSVPDARLQATIPTGLPTPFVQFSPEGERLSAHSIETNLVRILDVNDGAAIRSLVHPAPVESTAWHPDGHGLACASGDRIYLWDLARDTPSRIIAGHDAVVWRLAFHPGGEVLASTSADGTTRLWELATGRELSRLALPGSRPQFNRQGTRLPLHWNVEPRFRLCEVATGRAGRLWSAGDANGQGVRQPSQGEFSLDGRWLVVPGMEEVIFRDATNGRERGRVSVPGLASVALETGLEQFVTSGTNGLQRWTWKAGPDGQLHGSVIDLLDPSSNCGAAAASGSGQVAYVRGSEVRLAGSDQFFPFPGAWSLALSPDGGRLAAACLPERGLRLWDTRSRQTILDLTNVSAARLAFSPDSRRLAAGSGHELAVFDAVTGVTLHRAAREAAMHAGPAAFSPDGRLLAFAVTRTRVRLLDAQTFRELAHFDSPGAKMISWLTFDPASTQLTVATETSLIQLWDLPRLRAELAALGLDW